nr:glycosyltransferase family 25 protein [Parabacteroides goldsteinii]
MSQFKIKTYVINLLEDTERKVSISKELSKFECLDPEWVDAVNGKKQGKEELGRLFDYQKSKRYHSVGLAPGEIGCTLSHYECYKRLLASDQDVALIVEDDIGFDDDTPLNDLLKEAVRYMEHEKPVVLLLFSFGDYMGEEIPLKDGYIIHNAYKATMAAIYLINRQAAHIIVSAGPPYWIADDWSLFRRKGVRICGLWPSAAYHKDDSLGSTIGWDERQKRKLRIPRSFSELSMLMDECFRFLLKKTGIIKHRGYIRHGM